MMQSPATQWVPEVPVESPSGLVAPGKPRGKAMSLEDIADTIQANAPELARLLTQEQGKPLADATGEIFNAEGWEWAPTVTLNSKALEIEEEAEKIQASELVKQFKVEMGLSSPTEVADVAGGGEKTIGKKVEVK